MLKKPRAREYFSIKYCFAGEEEKIPHPLDKRHQQNDYIVLLKMFVILVIKINEEFCLQDKISKKGVDFYEL